MEIAQRNGSFPASAGDAALAISKGLQVLVCGRLGRGSSHSTTKAPDTKCFGFLGHGLAWSEYPRGDRWWGPPEWVAAGVMRL